MANDRWKLRKEDGKIYGPVDTETIRGWIQGERIQLEDYLSREDKEEWVEAKSIPQFQGLFVPAAKATPPPPETAQCPKCGDTPPQGTSFCVKCGANLKMRKKVMEKKEGTKMAKIVWGPIIILVIGLGIAIYAGRRPEVPPEEAVRPELERVEEIIEEDERIKALPEEAVWPDKEEKVDRLVQELRDEDRDVREDAAVALGRIGDLRAVKPLITTLKDEDSSVRESAAEALGRIGDSRAVEPLIAAVEAILKDKDLWVAMRAAKEAIFGDEDLIATLKEKYEDEVPEDVLMPLIMPKTMEVLGVMGKIEALVKIGEPAVEPLITALRDEGRKVLWAVIAALAKIGEPAVEPLIAALRLRDDPFVDPFIRMSAAVALGTIGDPRATIPLTAALRDEVWDVRWKAARALGEIGDPRAVEPLIAAMRDRVSGVRESAAEALREIGDPPQVVEPLIAMLRDKNSFVRVNAAEVLGRIGDPRAVEPLIAALRDEAAFVRRSMALVLGEIGDPRAVEPLVAMLRDRDEYSYVQRGVAEALGRIGDPRAVEPLIAALRDEVWVRKNAAFALGRIGDPRAVTPLIAALRDEDRDVRESATWALKGITGKDFGTDPAKWQEWWEENRETFLR